MFQWQALGFEEREEIVEEVTISFLLGIGRSGSVVTYELQFSRDGVPPTARFPKLGVVGEELYVEEVLVRVVVTEEHADVDGDRFDGELGVFG